MAMDDRKEMKLLGGFYKKILHANDSLENARKANKYCDFLRNKWLGKKTKMRSEYIERLDGTTLRICIVTAKEETSNENGLFVILESVSKIISIQLPNEILSI